MRVLMLPQLKWFRREESGIKRVVEALFRYLPDYGIEMAKSDKEPYDLSVSHAGVAVNPDVAHCHGLYWTADYKAAAWEWAANQDVVEALRNAREIIVPSEWVAEAIRRDMHRRPHVVGHGIDWEAWQHDIPDNGYVLWNKNRVGDVCDPAPVTELARAFPNQRFVATFADLDAPSNVQVTGGILAFDDMKKIVQACSVYLSTTKETFGIGTLEAMAAGIPVLGWAHGGNVDLVQHGVNGYLARPGDYADLAEGLNYCLAHRAVLGGNGRELARLRTWPAAVEKIAAIYRLAKAYEDIPPLVTVVIPSYNYADRVSAAIESVMDQTHAYWELYVVDDGSQDNTEDIVRWYCERDSRIHYVRQENRGVAHARNRGIAEGTGKYVCCLDADDRVAPTFLETCARALEDDYTLHLAYTGLWYIRADGKEGLSQWPGEWDFDDQLQKQNQVPTCCVYRREAWESLGGYRQRYAPDGAGAEDAEFWTRMGAAGYRAKKVTEEGLFLYSLGTGRVSGNPDYEEPYWLAWKPYVEDGQHPFASFATPARFSHPVRQYDEPVVSVVIPVSEKHAETVIDTLDSLEAQTFRQWEAICVWDGKYTIPESLRLAYPFVRWCETEGPQGPGRARNIGVDAARADLILFCDADDWLYPEAIEILLEEYMETGHAIYPDYVGKAFVSDVKDLAKDLQERVYAQSPDGEAVIGYKAYDYDCELAQRQPVGEKPYIWNLITTLFPKAWHYEVGGFDEDMVSWEDVDYWWRMARQGKCFQRVAKELVVYRFYTGSRRDEGVGLHVDLVAYLKKKYAQLEEPMGCPGCRKRRAAPPPMRPAARPNVREVVRQTPGQRQFTPQGAGVVGQEVEVNDSDFVMCLYASLNRGEHPVQGRAAFSQPLRNVPMVERGGYFFVNYGYHAGGDRFLVHKADQEAQPHLFSIEIERIVTVPRRPEPQATRPVPIPPPAKLSAPTGALPPKRDPDEADPFFDFQKLPGVTADMAEQLKALEVETLEDLLDLGEDGLQAIKGIGKRRAELILSKAREKLDGDTD